MSDAARLWRLARTVARHDRMADLLPELHQQALRVAGGRCSVLLQLNPRTGQLLASSAVGLQHLDPEPWMADQASRAAAERTWHEGTPLVFTDLPELTARLGTPASMLVPLIGREGRIGLIAIGLDAVERADTTRGEAAAVGDLTTLVLERAKLQREADLQQDLRDLVADLSRAVSSSLHLSASLEIFCDRTARLVSADRVSIWLHDRRARALELVASSEGADLAAAVPLAADNPTSPIAIAMRNTRVEMLPAADPGQGPSVLLPLRGRRRALGTMAIDRLRIEPGDEIDLLDRLEEVARQLSAAIENLWLFDDVLRSRRELESIFNSLTDLVVVSDARLRVTQANQAFARRHNRRAEQVIEKPISEFFGPDIVTWVQQLGTPGEEDALQSETRELADPLLGGTFLFTVSPLAGRNDARIGSVIVARDVTSQTRLEAEQTALRDRLTQSEKLAALGQFVAGIAHELNNPLQGVLGHVELMLHKSAVTPPRFKRDLKLVFREADRAAKIVHNLLVFAGSRRISRRRLNVSVVIRAVLSLRATSCAAAGIEIVKDLAAKLPRVAGDSMLLQQALLNIVVNAEQAVTGLEGPRRIDVQTLRRDAGTVEVRIADNGPGIAPEALTRLFEPFYTTKEVGEGTGLGLAIAYGIVQEHGGRLRAANRPEGGAMFIIELPSGSDGVE